MCRAEDGRLIHVKAYNIAELRLSDGDIEFRIKGSAIWRVLYMDPEHWNQIDTIRQAEGW